MARKSPFDWIVGKLKNDENVELTTIISDNLLEIIRTEGPNLSVTKTALDCINVADVKKILDTQIAEFILHIPKDPFVSGDVYDYLDSRKVILGGFGDLMRVVSQDSNWPYLSPDVRFITRGLNQHLKVRNVRRLDNKRYEIKRHGLETVVIIALNDYDLGIESIRAALHEFKDFDAVLKSNPNGGITSKAIEFTDSRDIKVYRWGELLGKLNAKWK